MTPHLDMFGIYKLKDGYFVHGETSNRYFDGAFVLQWEESGRDIFFCPTREPCIEAHADHVDVWDFEGNKYTYDEIGLIEYVPAWHSGEPYEGKTIE